MVESGSSELVSGQLREVSRTLEQLARALQASGVPASASSHYGMSRDPLVKQLAAAQLRQLHDRGHSYRSIAGDFGVTHERVRQLADRLGVEWRREGAAVEGDAHLPGPSQAVTPIRAVRHRLPG